LLEPLVSVIILNYNGLRFAEQCVRSVLDSDYANFEVILVDNGSVDGSYEVLTQSFGTVPKVRIVRNPINLGFAEGNNVGYRSSKGDIALFLNIDTEVRRNWLRPLVSSMIWNDKVGGAQCKLLSMEKRDAIDSAGGFLDVLGYVYPNRADTIDKDHEIFYAEGAAMAFKRSVLGEVEFDAGPFDISHFLYYEDSDLCWRVRLRGYEILLVPSSVAYHYRGGAGARHLGHMQTYYFTRSHILTLMKNYDLCNLMWHLSALLILELGHVIILFPHYPRRAIAKLAAIAWCLRNFRNTWVKRVFVQARLRKVSDAKVMCRMRRPNLLSAFASSRTYY
jgi:hypothetical protein